MKTSSRFIADFSLNRLALFRRFSISIIFLFVLAAPSEAQDANKIIEQYQKAAGGSKALSKLSTLTIEGTFSSSGAARSGTYTLDLKAPNRYYSELNIESGVNVDAAQQKLEAHHLIEAYNGKSAWHEDANGAVSSLLGMEALQMEDAALYYNLHFNNLKKNKRFNESLDIVHASGIQVREESVPSIVQAKQIVECIRILPIGYRTVLNLYAIEGYSHKEIADMLDIEESTSRSQYTRAKQMLEDILIRKKILPKPREKAEWLFAIR